MDRAIVHDIRNELAVATGTLHAMLDGKYETGPERLQELLGALEAVDALLTELRTAVRAPEQRRDELLQAIVEGSPYAKILVNRTGTITLVNAQAEQLFGYAREEMVGQPIDMLVPSRFRRGHPQLRDSYNEAPSARPMGAGRDLYGRRADGSEVPIEIGLNPIDIDGNRYTLAAISDITERKRAEELRLQHAGMQAHAEEIEALNAELNEASRFKSEFVATMSHELRTPLTAIVGATELLGRLPLTERATLHVSTINEAAEALLSLIGSILDFSKIEAGKIELGEEPFALDAVLEGAAEVVAQLTRERGVGLYTYIDPAIPPLMGDADRLRQIVLNLLGNAAKFTERGEIVARVFPLGLDPERVELRFEVEDTGIGIQPENLARLFEPFVQAGATTVTKYAGSGLGLSISKRLVELMNGEIGVQSELGRGSLFWFTAGFRRAPNMGPPALPSLENIAGLIVSTDAVFAQIVARYMDSWGMRSHHVTSREAMHATLRSDQASSWVAIVDTDNEGLPQLPDVIEALHAIQPSRVVVVGGGSLRKPIRQSYLFDAIARAADVRPPSRAAAPAGPAPVTLTTAPVLVAEDNTRLQGLLRLQFEELGVPVTFVDDGRGAVDALEQGDYAMVFMDCQMPRLDGLSATQAIRAAEAERGRHVPIVAMTANAFAEDREACLAAGMDDYLAKPVRLHNLRTMLERWAPAVATKDPAPG